MNAPERGISDAEDIDFRTWLAVKRIDIPRPPYPPELMVTPHSTFGEYVWRFDKANLAHGSRKRDKLIINRKVKVSGSEEYCLNPESLIMQQYKETMTAFIFHRAYLPARNDAAKSASLIRDGKRLLILYANVGAAGFDSIGGVTPTQLRKLFQRLPNAASVHDLLVGYFEDILVLSRQKLITDGPSSKRYRVATKQAPKEFFSKSKTRVLEDRETAFLLNTSRAYLDSAETIIEKLKAYDDGILSNQGLGQWAYENLPIRNGLDRASVRAQLIWLIRISAYSLLAFHLGSRASEALSATGNSIEVVRSSDGIPDEIYLWLTVAKGSKADGELRRYRVHPYFVRIFQCLRLVNQYLNVSLGGYIFQQIGGLEEIATTNLLQKVKRFVRIHGEEFDMSTHTWRFTLADLVVGTSKRPFHLLQQRFDHKFLSEAIGYGMHGPAADELKEAAREAAALMIEEFIAECETDELGGIRGTNISQALSEGNTLDDVRDDMRMLGIVPTKVGENTYCLIGSSDVPPCGTKANRQRREIARCRADCEHQAQTLEEWKKWSAFIEDFPTFAGDCSRPLLEKVRAVAHFEQNLIAWPSLRPTLEEMLRVNPDLRHYFG